MKSAGVGCNAIYKAIIEASVQPYIKHTRTTLNKIEKNKGHSEHYAQSHLHTYKYRQKHIHAHTA